MNYKDIVKDLKGFESETGYKEVVKAIICYEREIDNEKALNEVYEEYMDSDYSLLNENILDMIEEKEVF